MRRRVRFGLGTKTRERSNDETSLELAEKHVKSKRLGCKLRETIKEDLPVTKRILASISPHRPIKNITTQIATQGVIVEQREDHC